MANLDSFLGGWNAGNQIAETGRAQRNRAMVGNLAPAILGGDPQAFAKAAAVDPAAAKDLQLSGEGLMKRTRGAAQYLEQALKSGNQAQITAARRSAKPFLDTLQPGASYPLDMDPQQELAGIQSFLAQTAYLDPTLAKGTPTDVRSFQLMTQGLSPEDQERARRINLGLDGRASSAGFSQVKFTDAQGRERIGVLNGKTGQIDLPDGTSFNPQTGVISATQMAAQGVPAAGMYDTPNGRVNIGEGLTPDQWRAVQADVANSGASDSYQLPPRDSSPQAGMEVFTGRRKEDEARAIKTAELQTQLDYAPQVAQAEADAARQKKLAELGAERQYSGLPQAALSDILDAEDAIGIASGIQSNMARHLAKIDNGTLTFGPLENYAARGRNFAGSSDERSRNYQMFMSDIEKLRNDSLRLNKGVQTEGDAQRALNELFGSLNDPELVKAAIQRVIEINKRAEELQLRRIQTIRQNYAGPQAPTGQGGIVQRARNPQTGEVLELRNGQWVPAQ